MQANGLKLIPLKSDTKKVDGDFNLFISNNFDKKSFVVAYLDYKVLIGTWENSEFHFHKNEKLEQKFIQKLRIFNDDKELLLWRSGIDLKGRLRIDGQGKDYEVVIAKQALVGTTAESHDNFTQITENRGTNLILPFNNIQINNKRKRIFIKTYNYVDYNSIHQATYIDCRFVSFIDDKNNELN